MKILYVGDLWKGSTALHRYNAIKKLLPSTDCIDSTIKKNLVKAVCNNFFVKHFSVSFDFNCIKSKILRKITSNSYRIIWLDKAVYLNKAFLEKVKKSRPSVTLVFYSPDDYINRYHLTSTFKKAISLYDVFITTKSYNVNELYELGAKKVLFINNAFDPDTHKPLLDVIKSIDVLFIGGYEQERAKSILTLAESGVHVTVYGNQWSKLSGTSRYLTIVDENFYEDEYVRIINSAKICLNFLRKVNRDLQTTRSMEIPACGTMMMSEWSVEHQNLFKDKVEAVFFKNDEELCKLTKFYLNNSSKREEIAKSGYLKTQQAGYSNFSTIQRLLNELNNFGQ